MAGPRVLRARSLRARLVALILLLLAIAGIVIGVATTLALDRFLVGRFDADLRASADRFARPFGDGAPPDLPRLPPAARSDRGLPRARPTAPDPGRRAGRGADRARRGQRPGRQQLRRRPGELPGAARRRRARRHRPARRRRPADLPTLGDYRLLATTDADGDVRVVGRPADTVSAVVARLVVIEAIVIGATLLGAAVAGAVVVRRELRPLERVADTARTVIELPLDRGEARKRRSRVSLSWRAARAPPTWSSMRLSPVSTWPTSVRGSVVAVGTRSTSHELRTPLAAIRGYAELTRRAAQPPDTEYALVRISSQAERMSGLVEDMLLLARLDAGRSLERAPVDLTRLVLDAVDDAHAAGPDYHWRLALPDEPVTVSGDAQRLAQVLANLLANARTHTPEGTAVVAGIERADGAVRLSVVDDGPGIPAELVPRVFERFVRGEKSRSRAAGSTGLGLAIVSAVVGAHGGTVAIESEPGRTAFTVTLPAGPSHSPSAAAAPPAHSAAPEPRQV